MNILCILSSILLIGLIVPIDAQTNSSTLNYQKFGVNIEEMDKAIKENRNTLDAQLNKMEKLEQNQKIIVQKITNHTDTSNVVSLKQIHIAWIGIVISATVAGLATWRANVASQGIKKVVQSTGARIVNSVLGSSVSPTLQEESKPLKISDQRLDVPDEMKISDESITKTKIEYPQIQTKIKNILDKIGTENISRLAQQAKIIAIETNDKKFQEWLDNELNGYVREKTPKHTRKKDLGKDIPDYRHIQTKFNVQLGDGSVHELTYPLWISQSLPVIEDWLRDYEKKPGGIFTIKWTFEEDIKLVKGKTVNLIIQESQLRMIIHGAESLLSEFLESKLS